MARAQTASSFSSLTWSILSRCNQMVGRPKPTAGLTNTLGESGLSPLMEFQGLFFAHGSWVLHSVSLEGFLDIQDISVFPQRHKSESHYASRRTSLSTGMMPFPPHPVNKVSHRASSDSSWEETSHGHKSRRQGSLRVSLGDELSHYSICYVSGSVRGLAYNSA